MSTLAFVALVTLSTFHPLLDDEPMEPPKQLDTIDVLALYDPALAIDYGSHEAVHAAITTGHQALEAAVGNSDIEGLRFRIVHFEPVDFDTSTVSASDLLGKLVNNDLVLDHVVDLREAVGADLVNLYGKFTGIKNGQAMLGGYRMIYRTLAAVPHEIGHNMGVDHALGNEGVCSSGWLTSGGVLEFGTVVTTAPEQMLPLFANPDFSWIDSASNVLPLGDDCANPAPIANAAQQLRDAKQAKASLMPSVTRFSGVTEVASVESGVVDLNAALPSLSGDGHYVAFATASALSPADTNNVRDVYIRDLAAGSVTLVSRIAGGAAGNGWSDRPCVSADGRYVAFESVANNLVSGDLNMSRDVFRLDRDPDGNGIFDDVLTGGMLRVSEASGAVVQADSEHATISASGHRVAFASDQPNLVSGDINGVRDVFVADIPNGAMVLASPGSSQASDWPELSGDGTFVVFQSLGHELIPSDVIQSNTSAWNVFTRELGDESGAPVPSTVELHSYRLSVNMLGGTRYELTGDSTMPTISNDGRFIAFESTSSELSAADNDSLRDIYWLDRDPADDGKFDERGGPGDVSGPKDAVRFRLASVRGQAAVLEPNVMYANRPADNEHYLTTAERLCQHPAISSDGAFVAFHSKSSRLVACDTNDSIDVFVRSIYESKTSRVSVSSNEDEALLPSGSADSRQASISADGRRIAFRSAAQDLDAADMNLVDDVFVHTVDPRRFDAEILSIQVTTGSGSTSVAGLVDPDNFDGVMLQSSLVGGSHATEVEVTLLAPDISDATEIRLIVEGAVSDLDGTPSLPAIVVDVRDFGSLVPSWITIALGTAHLNWIEDVKHGSLPLNTASLIDPLSGTIVVRIRHDDVPNGGPLGFETRLDWLRVRVQ